MVEVFGSVRERAYINIVFCSVRFQHVTCKKTLLYLSSIFNLQWFRPEKASAVLGVCVTCIVGACGSVSVYLQHCDL